MKNRLFTSIRKLLHNAFMPQKMPTSSVSHFDLPVHRRSFALALIASSIQEMKKGYDQD